MAMIKLTGINKIYRTNEIETLALENVNLDVAKGEFVSIMGPSGCGKSTLLNIMGLLDAPSSGKIEINGTSVESMKDKELAAFRNKTLGFVFQSFHLINSLNVIDNVELPLLYRKMAAKERTRLAKEVLDRVGLSHRMRHMPTQLSGGQCQRVAIARAIVGKHDVLLKESAADICSKLASLLKSLKDLLTVSLYGNKGKFEEDDLRSIFAAYDMDVPSAKRFITSLLESRVEEGRSVSYITSAKKKDEDKLMFTVTRGFDLLLSRYQKLCAQRITGKKGDRLLFYVTPFSDLNMLLNLLSMLNVVDFTVEGGVPSVGVRVRDAEILKKEAVSGDYQNHVLENNEKIFQEQIELFRLFFGNTKLSNEQRWEFIEDYFTGMSLEGLKEKYSCVVE